MEKEKKKKKKRMTIMQMRENIVGRKILHTVEFRSKVPGTKGNLPIWEFFSGPIIFFIYEKN